MKTFMTRAIALALIVLAAWTFAWVNGGIFGFRWWSWHQKLTVMVETPDGTKSAASVTEASWEMPPEWFRLGDSGGGHGSGKLKGEAVSLELGSGKYLFVLLKDYSSETAIWTFAEPPLKNLGREEYTRGLDRVTSVRDTRELSPMHYPVLVTFGDINDPASVQRVDPADLETSFGPGYRLNSITISLTDEPMTKGKVKKVLGWLPQYYNTHLDGNRLETIKAENRFANSLASGDFDTEKN